MLSLNLRLHSMNFVSNAICTSGKIHVNILTFPDMQKQSVSIDSKMMCNSSALFEIKYEEHTNNIIIFFVKKNIFSKDEVLASACINTKDIDENQTGCMKVDLYEPAQQKERRIIGSMRANFRFKEIFTYEKYENRYNMNEQTQLQNKLNNLYENKKINSQYIFN